MKGSAYGSGTVSILNKAKKLNAINQVMIWKIKISLYLGFNELWLRLQLKYINFFNFIKLKKDIQIAVNPEIGYEESLLYDHVIRYLRLNASDQVQIRLIKRSIDARFKKVKVNIWAEVYVNEDPAQQLSYSKPYRDVRKSQPVIIVGSGPAGMFAALRFLELGIKPVILERGKDVRSRRRDLAAINKDHTVNPDSNYCYGEGGAGTYSDGKLYTRSKKRGDFNRIMQIFVAHEANPLILVESHPHIGTNKLPKVVANIRQSILDAGGEIHFNTRVSDLWIEGDELKGVIDQYGNTFKGAAAMLATGHSAREIFHLLKEKNIKIERKPYALGVRIEHPQSIIDRIQYHCPVRGDYLPAASYSLVTQVSYDSKQKGVFSFCMCPGGFIVPSATSPGEIVINGMSPSRRNSRFANSGIVVAIDDGDLKNYEKHEELAGVYFQMDIEQRAYALGGHGQTAPAQLMIDFVKGKVSTKLNESSYQPGLNSVQLAELFPEPITHRLRQGLRDFGRKMKGYYTNEAQLVGVESRTSSPVRIPRDPVSYEHIQLKRLFPAGEGAGYAGGIASAAIDGERCAESIARLYFK
jgi:uncharacterized FAD-dependent dehydrogenase